MTTRLSQILRLAQPAPVLIENANLARKDLPSFLWLCGQLGLVWAVMVFYGIEGTARLPEVMPIIFAVFCVHAWLPLRWRLPLFVLTCAAVVVITLGWAETLWLFLCGLVLIGLCHLPVAMRWRVLLVLAVSTVLAFVQVGKITVTEEFSIIVPVLGSIFMFRLAIYLYDIQHEKTPVTVWQRLAYFFLIPNPLFPLFPVVDYKTFLRTYYDGQASDIYQKGVLWMYRGVTHLLLYRLVYYNLCPAPEDVHDLSGVLTFAISAYLLYLRISGQFHLIVGMLCLFGFNLPHTHRFYLLASGFNDYWRRINIYWKDFMMKMVYYPVYMRVRKLGMTSGLVIATAAVFFVTWLLHSYQWFWLQGSFPMHSTDALFWGLFGVLVIINTLYEAKGNASRKSKRSKQWDIRRALKRSCQIALMFLLMALLWSFWSSDSIGQWLNVMAQARHSSPMQVTAWLLLLAAGLGIGVGVQWWNFRREKADRKPVQISSTVRGTAFAIFAVLLCAASLFQNHTDTSGWRLTQLMDQLRGLSLNARDQALVERGYYEGLLSNKKSYTASQVRAAKEDEEDQFVIDWDTTTTWQPTGDFRYKEYLPKASSTNAGKEWSTNSWGMRDQEYAREKPPGCWRAAVLGASYTMGRGVKDGETFEAREEARLNEGRNGTGSVEFLNFAVSDYSVLDQILVLEHRVAEFQPDAVFVVVHKHEKRRVARRLSKLVTEGQDLGFPYLEQLKRRSLISPQNSSEENVRRLLPFGDEIREWIFGQMVERIRAMGAEPVWMYLPLTRETAGETAKLAGEEEKAAAAAGFHTIVLDKAYGGLDAEELKVSTDDYHPNREGHAAISRRFHEKLVEIASRIGLKIGQPPSGR